jgi:hypothetical protein
MGWAPDVYAHLWNLWWVKHQLLGLHNPFHTGLLLYPQGSDLYLHTVAPVNGVMSMPLQIATGNVLLSWNVLVLLFFTASGVGAYALAYHVTRDPWASLAGGVVFAFAPFVMTHLHGHFNIATTWPIPFFVLSVLLLHETRRPRYAVFAGVLMAVLTWNWLEFAIDSGLFVVILFVFWTVIYVRRQEREKAIELFKQLALLVAVWLPLSLPILIPTFYEVAAGDVEMRGALSPVSEYYSADLLGFVSPSPLWGPGKLANCDCGNPYPTVIGGVEGTVYLGILPLLLAVFALLYYWRTRRRWDVIFWASIFAFFTVMALGPYLYIDSNKVWDVGFMDFSISLPYRVFQKVPLIGLRRVPARMVIYSMLSLAVLAPLGITALREILSSKQKYIGQALGLLALALVMLEFWNPPVSLNSFQVPPIYDAIADEPGDYTLLELPVGRITSTTQRGDIIGGGMADFSQMTHGKATIGGYISRGKPKDILWLREQPGIGYLSCPNCPDFPREQDLDGDRVRSLFEELRIRYVIVNLRDFEGAPTSIVTGGYQEQVIAYLEDTLQLERVDEGDGWLAYKVDS